MFVGLFYYCQKTGIKDLHGNHTPSRRFQEELCFVCTNARGQATEREPALRGDTWRRTSVHTHRCQGRAAARQELRTGCFGKRSGGAPPQQPLQVALSATRAIRGAGHSQADAPASARPPEDAGVRVTCSDHWGEQRSGSESPGSCRFKGRGRSREAARSFWLPEPAPSAAARPLPLPEGAHGSGRLSADCRKLNLSS